MAVTATAPETAETTGLEPSVQVALTGPSFELLQTVVLFESEERALELIAGIKNDMAGLGISQEPVGGFRDISGIDEKATPERATGRYVVLRRGCGAGTSHGNRGGPPI